MKKIIKHIIKILGYKVSKCYDIPLPGSSSRPVGRVDYFLEDVKERGLICNVVLDIGANNGNWSRMTKRIFPDAMFYLVEPQIEMLNHLQKFCSDYPDSKYFLLGAGSKKETRILTIWEDLVGSSVLPKENTDLIKAGKQRKINIETIDDLILKHQLTRPDIIKLDIQGFELEALKGAESTFGNTELYIVEVSMFPFDDTPGVPLFSEVINFMSKRDYVLYDFAGFSRRPVDGALGQCDLCFIRRASFLRESFRWNR